MVQARIQNAAADKPFGLIVTDSAREFLLTEGTDSRYVSPTFEANRAPYRLPTIQSSLRTDSAAIASVRATARLPDTYVFNEAPPAFASSQVAGRIAA